MKPLFYLYKLRKWAFLFFLDIRSTKELDKWIPEIWTGLFKADSP